MIIMQAQSHEAAAAATQLRPARVEKNQVIWQMIGGYNHRLSDEQQPHDAAPVPSVNMYARDACAAWAMLWCLVGGGGRGCCLLDRLLYLCSLLRSNTQSHTWSCQ